MAFRHISFSRIIFLAAFFVASFPVLASQGGNAGSVQGTVTDPTGAVIPGASIRLSNDRSGFDRSLKSDAQGEFDFSNVPFNSYRLTVSAAGFA
ncbi:MAG TPA: carboxypeptidase-like regulatory domain-containing protein, partial [Terracidiphilus sp.]